MCVFLSIAVPTRADGRAPVSRRGYQMARHDHAALVRALPAGFSIWTLTTNGCSCHLVVEPTTNAADAARVSLRDDATDLLAEVASRCDRMFVYVHEYAGDITTERLPTLRRERRRQALLTPGVAFELDTLVELVRN